MAKKNELYAENGISISKSPVYAGDTAIIGYDGLLARSGAEMVYIHMGYGDNWDNKDLIPMESDGKAFKAAIDIAMAGTLNFVFKDSAENWDNNSSMNYSIKVSKKAARSKKAADVEAGEKATARKTTAKVKDDGDKETASTKKTASKTPDTKKTVKKTTKKKDTSAEV